MRQLMLYIITIWFMILITLYLLLPVYALYTSVSDSALITFEYPTRHVQETKEVREEINITNQHSAVCLKSKNITRCYKDGERVEVE